MFGKGPEIQGGEVIEPAETVDVKPSKPNYDFVPKPAGQQRQRYVENMQSVIQQSPNQPQIARPRIENQAPVNSVVEQQRLEIERMRLEIERLRQSQPVSGQTILTVPSLSGPGG